MNSVSGKSEKFLVLFCTRNCSFGAFWTGHWTVLGMTHLQETSQDEAQA
jgi:hypothetical protein